MRRAALCCQEIEVFSVSRLRRKTPIYGGIQGVWTY